MELEKCNFTRADIPRTLQSPDFFHLAALPASQAPDYFTVQGLTLVNPRNSFFHLLTPCAKERKGRGEERRQRKGERGKGKGKEKAKQILLCDHQRGCLTLNPPSAPGKPRALAQVHRAAGRAPRPWFPVLSVCLLHLLPSFLLPSLPLLLPFLPSSPSLFPSPLSLSLSYMILLYIPSWSQTHY